MYNSFSNIFDSILMFFSPYYSVKYNLMVCKKRLKEIESRLCFLSELEYYFELKKGLVLLKEDIQNDIEMAELELFTMSAYKKASKKLLNGNYLEEALNYTNKIVEDNLKNIK